MPDKKSKAVLMHISDLHFGLNLDQTKQLQNIKEKTIKILTNAAFKNTKHHVPSLSHQDITLCDRLAIMNLREELNIDYLIVSGDLTNLGDVESLRKAKEFLTNSWDHDEPGLGFDEKKILVVPGNHDTISNKYPIPTGIIRKPKPTDRLKNYYQVFPTQLPYSIPPTDLNGRKFTFFCFDSTSPKYFFFSDGEIEEKNITWFYRETKNLARGYGEDYLGSVKIVIFHHHPIPLPGATPSIWTQLIDGSKFLPLLQNAGVDLVLHGHEHFEATCKIEYIFQNSKQKPLTVCAAGTATQYNSNKNAFNVYCFYEEEAFLEIWEHDKRLSLFRPLKDKIRLF